MGADLSNIQCPGEHCNLYEAYNKEMRQINKLGRYLEDFIYPKYSAGLDEETNSSRIGFSHALSGVCGNMAVNMHLNESIEKLLKTLAKSHKSIGNLENEFANLLNFVLLTPVQKSRIINLKEVQPAYKLLMNHTSKENPSQKDIKEAHDKLHNLIFAQNQRFCELRDGIYAILEYELQFNRHNNKKVNNLMSHMKSDKGTKSLCEKDPSTSGSLPILDYRIQLLKLDPNYSKKP